MDVHVPVHVMMMQASAGIGVTQQIHVGLGVLYIGLTGTTVERVLTQIVM